RVLAPRSVVGCLTLVDSCAYSATGSAMRGQNHAAITAFLPANQHEVANVDRETTPLSDGEHGIASVERVREQHKPAGKTEPPERDRNGASMGSLAHDPLR